MSHPIKQKDQPVNTKSHYNPQYYKEKATQIFDENLANKNLPYNNNNNIKQLALNVLRS